MSEDRVHVSDVGSSYNNNPAEISKKEGEMEKTVARAAGVTTSALYEQKQAADNQKLENTRPSLPTRCSVINFSNWKFGEKMRALFSKIFSSFGKKEETSSLPQGRNVVSINPPAKKK
jgi:hypothetical protein